MPQGPHSSYDYPRGSDGVYNAQPQEQNLLNGPTYRDTHDSGYPEEYQASPTPQLREEDMAILDEALLWIPSQPYSKSSLHRLEQPVAIPRMDVAGSLSTPLPFIRAYAPVLESHQIDENVFVAFIDNLCVAQSPSPPLQLLNIAGNGIGMIPHHWAMATGVGIQVVAGMGMSKVSAARIKAFLEKSNEQFFNPRGLKVRLCKDDELAKVVGFPEGETALAPVDLASNCFRMRDRRMKALAPYVAALTFDVAPSNQERNILDQIVAKQLERRVARKDKKDVKKHEKKHAKYEAKIGTENRLSSSPYVADDDSDASSILSIEQKMIEHAEDIESINLKAETKLLKKKPEKAKKIEKKRQEDIVKIEDDRRKTEARLQQRMAEGKVKRGKRAAKLEYILIENL